MDDPAFPVDDSSGLTKREWATVLVLQGLLAGGANVGNIRDVVNSASELAEAALAKAGR